MPQWEDAPTTASPPGASGWEDPPSGEASETSGPPPPLKLGNTELTSEGYSPDMAGLYGAASMPGVATAMTRGAVASTIGGLPDIAWSALKSMVKSSEKPEASPSGFASYMERAVNPFTFSFDQPVTSALEQVLPGKEAAKEYPGAQKIGEMVPLPGVGGAAVGIARGAAKAGEVTGTVFGKAAKAATEALRSEQAAQAGKLAQSAEEEAATYKRRLEAAETAQAQLGARGATPEERANIQALRSDAFAQESEAARKSLADQHAQTIEDYRQAGASTKDAITLAAHKEQQIVEAENGVAQLEKDMLAQPQINADTFGARIRALTQQLYDKYSKARTEGSGFKQAVESAGNAPRVNTAPIVQTIDTTLQEVRNPQLSAALNKLKDLLKTGDADALSIKSADSLRGTLDQIIHSKQFGELKVDKETLHFVGEIKKQLVKTATEAWQPYREALGRYRTLSRPLDIVERKGALKPVLDTDPLSSEYAMTEARVVGQVLRTAKQGNPVFTRLIGESPELRDSARLYFTHDLFSKGDVPSAASLRTWLKNNESALRQLGLYDEFRDLRVARETAQKAVAEAKGEAKLSKEELRRRDAEESAAKARVAQVETQRSQLLDRASSARERTRQNMIAKAQRLAQQSPFDPAVQAQSRRMVAEAQRLTASPEEIAQRSAARASEAERRLKAQRATAQSEALRQDSIRRDFTDFKTKLELASSPQAVIKVAKAAIEKMRDTGHLDDAAYKRMMAQVETVAKSTQDAATRKRILITMASGAAAGLIGPKAVSMGRNALGF